MTTSPASTTQPTAIRRFRPSFFLCMTLLMAIFVFGGFGMTYWFPLVKGSFPPAPPVVHLHGLVFSAWMILLVVQALLVNVRNIPLHRSLGTFGIALATAVVFMGALITLLSGVASRDNPGANYYHGLYLGIMAVLGFGILFTLAMRTVRTPAIHKRMILFALLPLLPPGVHRVFMVPFGLSIFPVLPMYLTLDAMALAILVHEWHQSGRINPYSIIGAGWLLLQQALHYPLTHSAGFADFLYALTGMVHYR